MESQWEEGKINYIESHCKIKDTLQEAAIEVLNRAKPEDDEVENEDLYNERIERFSVDVAEKYNIFLGILSNKVNIMRQMNNFRETKKKYELALDAYKSHKHITKNYSIKIAERYSVEMRTLRSEITKFNKFKVKGLHYEYDRYVQNNNRGFTYMEEKELLKRLQDWATVQRNQQNLPSINVVSALKQV